jgi:hypothetical protein
LIQRSNLAIVLMLVVNSFFVKQFKHSADLISTHKESVEICFNVDQSGDAA